MSRRGRTDTIVDNAANLAKWLATNPRLGEVWRLGRAAHRLHRTRCARMLFDHLVARVAPTGTAFEDWLKGVQPAPDIVRHVLAAEDRGKNRHNVADAGAKYLEAF